MLKYIITNSYLKINSFFKNNLKFFKKTVILYNITRKGSVIMKDKNKVVAVSLPVDMIEKLEKHCVVRGELSYHLRKAILIYIENLDKK